MTEVVPLSTTHPSGRRSMAERVRQFSRAGFVGRAGYRRVFGSALAGEPGAPQVLFVHGPGGIGKSTLLRRLADDAEERGHAVVWVNGEYVLTSTTALVEAVAPVHASARPVLVIDGFEHCQALETWIREQLLPTVPEDTVVVIAGRHRPDPHWTLDPGWRHLVRMLALAPLNPDEAGDLLTQRGVPGELHATVNGFAAGHPLTLCLAAEETAAPPTTARDAAWKPSPQVIETLLARMIDRVPSAAHEYGLRVCGHVRHVTVGLLRTGLNEHDAHTVFDWLTELPYVEVGRHGLICHELVREVLDSSFKWRDPVAYHELHMHLYHYLLRAPSSMSGNAVEVAVRDVLYLTRYLDQEYAQIMADQERESLFISDYTPEMREDLLRITRENESDECARLVAYWLDRKPEAFKISCRAEDLTPVSFFAWLRLSPETDDLTDDPALGPIREYLDHVDRIGPGEHVGVARFQVPVVSAERCMSETVLNASFMSTLSMHQRDGLVATFMLIPEIETFGPEIEQYDFRTLRSMPELGAGGWGVVVHDWREVPMEPHFERIEKTLSQCGAPGDSARDVRAAPAMSPEEFFAAVKQALRDWHDDEAIAVNQLIGVYGAASTLRTAVVTTVDTLRQDRRRIKHQRAVQATYLDRDTNQKAAAARLGVPFSTYRRHLQAGTQEICAALWHSREEYLKEDGARAAPHGPRIPDVKPDPAGLH
ncbi:ATP-binding protein [Amycolatopsis sp. NPDC059021]|uniref:ATP-binding protein n=1 Tax=Amycolatopsis sp. NPDC059021 TaxID=3346704 RepID=UPI00366E0552